MVYTFVKRKFKFSENSVRCAKIYIIDVELPFKIYSIIDVDVVVEGVPHKLTLPFKTYTTTNTINTTVN